MTEEKIEIKFICGECAYCSDGGADPQNVQQHIYNCHVKPPKAFPVANPQGVAIMTIRPSIQPGDISCKDFEPKETH